MSQEILKFIFLFMLGTTVLNLAISVFARVKTRHQEFTLLIYYWLSILSTYFTTVALSANSTQIAYAMYLHFIPCAIISQILSNSREIKFDWKFYSWLNLGGMLVSSLMIHFTDLGFTLSLIPVAFTICAPMYKSASNALITDRHNSNWVEKGMALTMTFGTINVFNYAFFRLDDSMAFLGWAISITCYQSLSIYLPLLIHIRREKKERRNLELSIERMSGVNPNQNEDTDELYRHLEIQISQKEQYLKELKASNQDYEEEREMNDILIKTISHDLANPLTVINAYMEMLRNGKIPKEDKEKIWDRMKVNMDHALNMIVRIRKAIVTRTQANLISLQPIDLSVVLYRVGLLFEEKLAQKNIRLVINNTLPKDVFILGEENALSEHILANILSNAIKFSFENNQIVLNAYVNEDLVTVEVRDYGTGIKIDRMNKMSTTAGTQGEEGTGFGLVIMGYFVRKFGASVDYINHEERGSQGTSVLLKLKSSKFTHPIPPLSESSANIFS